MSETLSSFSGHERTEPLYYFFGQTGGTVHQLAELTGLTVADILYNDQAFQLSGGFSAVRTCELRFRVDKLAPKHQGGRAFWASVIIGFWATGPLRPQRA